ncbi:MAG TPA: class I SAM-dependent methyltransferase, partial [Verrucomicrobiales bacterium]|nr:class I SAM-dependent methyltransferase [Verrucomicrobiales bacterium]
PAAAWEAAYRRFESQAEELRKFGRRLRHFGVEEWPRDLKIVELFCGRGNGLRAWRSLGFVDLTGIDHSARLLKDVEPEFRAILADVRDLPLPDGSVDVISIHGGLHHLPKLPEDVARVLTQCHRVLRTGGRLLVVEPWQTPFLRFVHLCCRSRLLRCSWPRLDALAEMIELEAETYFAWLGRAEAVIEALAEVFPPDRMKIAWGKLHYLARRR